jgi:large subunit ribosomal protein L6
VVTIKLVGVGYKAVLEGGSLVLRVGLSHNVVIPIEADIKCTVPSQNKIVLCGIDLKTLTGFAAKIRRVRPPEPYSGKGIYIGDEQIKRKQGKTSK